MIRIVTGVLLSAVMIGACGVKTDLVPPDVMVPEAVEDLQGVVRKGAVYLIWTAPRKNLDGSRPVDLVAFTVLRRDETRGCIDCPGTFTPVERIEMRAAPGAPTARSFRWEDRRLHDRTIYLYKVTGENHWGYQGPASRIVTIHWCQPPPAPEHLMAEPRDSSVFLSWSPVPAASGYHVYRRHEDTPFPFNPVNQTPISSTNFLDTRLHNETDYYYEVRAVLMCADTPVEGGSPREIQARPVDTTAPQPPAGLTAFPQGDGIVLDWLPNFEADLHGYHVYRWETSQEVARRLNDRPITESSFLDNDVQRGIHYYYAVTAVDSSPRANESPRSEAVTVSY